MGFSLGGWLWGRHAGVNFLKTRALKKVHTGRERARGEKLLPLQRFLFVVKIFVLGIFSGVSSSLGIV